MFSIQMGVSSILSWINAVFTGLSAIFAGVTIYHSYKARKESIRPSLEVTRLQIFNFDEVHHPVVWVKNYGSAPALDVRLALMGEDVDFFSDDPDSDLVPVQAHVNGPIDPSIDEIGIKLVDTASNVMDLTDHGPFYKAIMNRDPEEPLLFNTEDAQIAIRYSSPNRFTYYSFYLCEAGDVRRINLNWRERRRLKRHFKSKSRSTR